MTMQELTTRILLNNLLEAIKWHRGNCNGDCNVSLLMLVETAKFMLLFVPENERNELRVQINNLSGEV